MIKGFNNKTSARHAPLLVVIVGVILYSVVYSYITVSKFYAYNATIFDLGVNANLIYSVFHGGVSFVPGTPHFINTGKMIYLVLAPFYNLYPYEQVLLVFQSVWIAVGAIPLYYMAQRKLGNGIAPVAIGLSWLMYYPMAGVNWFDFHFMAIFPTLFLSGLAALVYGRKKMALVFLILSTITDFLIPLVMIVFAAFLLYRDFKRHECSSHQRLAISLIAISTFILIVTNLTNGLAYTTGYEYSAATQLPVFKANFWYISEYFVRILFPLGFISILAPEYLVILLPFLGLAALSQYRPYVDTMFIQYPALTAPIIFIAAVKGIEKWKSNTGLRFPKLSYKKIAVLILVLNIVLAIFVTPVGNIGTNSIYDKQLGQLITGNGGIYETENEIHTPSNAQAISKLISMIPSGSSVFAQNNFPQLAQGNQLISPSEILSNSSSIPYPDYVMVDPYNSFFVNPVFPGEQQRINAMNAFNKLLDSGMYGVLGESAGIILLMKNYSSSPLIYKPLINTYNITNLRIPAYVNVVNISGISYMENFTGGTAWYGPYITLPPGTYFLNYSMLSHGLTSNDSLSFQVGSFSMNSSNTDVIYQKNLNASSFSTSGYFNGTIQFQVSGYMLHVEFRSVNVKWSSPLSVRQISFYQTSWE